MNFFRSVLSFERVICTSQFFQLYFAWTETNTKVQQKLKDKLSHTGQQRLKEEQSINEQRNIFKSSPGIWKYKIPGEKWSRNTAKSFQVCTGTWFIATGREAMLIGKHFNIPTYTRLSSISINRMKHTRCCTQDGTRCDISVIFIGIASWFLHIPVKEIFHRMNSDTVGHNQ